MQSPTLSVIIPAYNSENWVGCAIHSVLEQTFQNFEIIVVDDGSTDGTWEVISRTKDARICRLRQENRGLSAARNAGIRISRAEYIVFLDADDQFMPQALEKLLAAFENDQSLSVVGCGHLDVDTRGRVLAAVRLWVECPIIDLRRVLFGCPMLPTGMAVRRQCFNKVGYFDESLCRYEDWEFMLRLAHHGFKIGWVQEILCIRLQHNANMSTAPELVHAATDCAIVFLTRFYEEPDLAPEIRKLRGKVFGHMYLDAAARAYASGMGASGCQWLRTALECDPDLNLGERPVWVRTLCGFATGVMVRNLTQYLSTMAHNLPPEAEPARWTYRRLVAEVYAAKAFKLRMTDPRGPVRYWAVRALLNNTRLLRDCGLISLAVYGGRRRKKCGAVAA